MIKKRLLVFIWVLFACCACSKNSANVGPGTTTDTTVYKTAEWWLTTANQSSVLQKQNTALTFLKASHSAITITVDSASKFQEIDGFGYTLTGGSAYLINQLPDDAKNNLLQQLFGTGNDAIGVSYLRVSIGASDLDASVFSYDDLPTGQTDEALAHFSLSNDTVNLIPVLKKILAINPAIKILASPWSPPVWMKDNNNSIGGSLLPQYYNVYAKYFVKYIQQMQALGIAINAVTVQNEPQHGGNNPSLLMSATQQADFVKNHLGPAFRLAGIGTKIIIWDHNCDNAQYPISVLNDAAAKAFIDGSAFHLYNGEISALSAVHAAHPDKNLYFTEQWTGANGSFAGDFMWHTKNVIIGAMRNWSKVALEWNLANDPAYAPHTPGGCTECKGALTINGSFIARNVSYYIIAHASKFVPPGSVRIASNNEDNLYTVAFITPAGKKVLIVLNDGDSNAVFSIKYNSLYAAMNLPAKAVSTCIWQ